MTTRFVHLAAVAWIISLGSKRGAGLPGAAKILLMAMWSYVPGDIAGDASHRQCWPSREALAEATGSSMEAVKEQLRLLAALGWIRRKGRGWDLAWQVSFSARAAVQTPAAEDQAPAVQTPEGRKPRGFKPRRPGVQAAQIIPDQTTRTDQTKIASNEPAPTTESPAAARGQARMQQTLFEQADLQPTPTRDYAAEVFDYLRERIIATKIDLGIKPARGPTVLAPADRRNIEARIREQQTIDGRGDGLEAGLQACKQVIDVDEADSRRQGRISNWWNATTPFRNASNFDARLGRWREDGRHQIFGKIEDRKPRSLGFRASVSDEVFDEMIDELGGAEST